MPHATFFPIKRSFYEAAGKQYGADAHRLLANGPFQLTIGRTAPIFDYGKTRITGTGTILPCRKSISVTSLKTIEPRLNLFADNRIALVRLGAETVKDASALGLRLRTFQSGGLSYLRFNMIDTSITRYKNFGKPYSLYLIRKHSSTE